jgi:hypothetical protein
MAYRREGNLFLVMSSSSCRRAADDHGLFPRKGRTERDWMPDCLVSDLDVMGSNLQNIEGASTRRSRYPRRALRREVEGLA